jgi:hypothetical protein
MRILHFIDTAGSDECFVYVKNVDKLQVISSTQLHVYFTSTDAAVATNDRILLTCATGYTDEVALKLAEYMFATNIGGGSVLTVDATNFDAKLESVAYTAGA